MKNIKKKTIILIGIILLIVILTICLFLFRDVKVGTIKDGKIKYIDKIVNVTKYEDNLIIEFKNDYEYINNCIITTNIYNKLKNKDSLYEIKVIDYSKLNDISNKEAYNINRALQENIIDENDKYHEYLSKTCGFKNRRELLKYIEGVIKINNKGIN